MSQSDLPPMSPYTPPITQDSNTSDDIPSASSRAQPKLSTALTTEASYSRPRTRMGHHNSQSTVGTTSSSSLQVQTSTYSPPIHTLSQSSSFQSSVQEDRRPGTQSQPTVPGTTTTTTLPMLPKSSQLGSNGMNLSAPTCTDGAISTTDMKSFEDRPDWVPNSTAASLDHTLTSEDKVAITSVASSSGPASDRAALSLSNRTSLATSASSLNPLTAGVAFGPSLQSGKNLVQEMFMGNTDVSRDSKLTPRTSGNTLPWYPSTAVLISLSDHETAKESSLAPIDSQSSIDPFLLSSLKPKTGLDSTVAHPPRVKTSAGISGSSKVTTAITPSASSNRENDAFASNTRGEQSPKQKATTAGIALGAVGVGLLFGATTFIVAKRYKNRRLSYQRFSSATGSQNSLEIRCVGLEARPMGPTAPHSQPRSHQSDDSHWPQISRHSLESFTPRTMENTRRFI
ncbi:hypothetical protein Purlil1_13377 [Purpureocillium lilacinum]|uniref:Uncharacterized protein n=1 Tax=Purpureocillium lilacinum TaxID=33203 RepID=A0ABR0BEA1_PURLI|nr:hypothetical protein Purlil1_13377 [Purpureocillium lilacinum]